jgi:small multidrug resistance pump
MKAYFFLLLAIGAEIIATASLKKANGFTLLWPSLYAVAGYAMSAFFLSLALKQVPVGVAYAIWASLGIVFSALLGWIFYQEKINLTAWLGMGLILSGVLVVSLTSKTSIH